MINLAEAIQFTATDVAIIIVVLLVALLVCLALFVAGCKAAARAGAGSQKALILWVVIALVELYLTVSALFNSGQLIALMGVTALAIQAAMYLKGRKGRSGPG